MEESSIESKILLYIKNNKLIIFLLIFGFVSLIIGIFQFSINKSDDDMTFQKGDSEVAGISTGSANLNLLYIDISGQVIHPGVYKIPSNGRVQDVLLAAGGLTAQADTVYISKYLNLAQKLSDGQKIYIPKVGETKSTEVNIQSQTAQSGVPTNGKINVNTASSDSLDSLPGVGPVTANKIISGRPYSDINDLLSKKIVSSRVFGEIKDNISVY